ncbi:Hypothetical proteinA [Nesidiocoris tenuis]|uniref:Kinesin motor domain-containing protein n=1 Tax=Nesidiocoris tenuis TaxID=355587 RepID=A0ABN7BDC2_9HEMI|nr:Hypothetical proteinA [Nesidiocoris tenuis]
MSWSARLKTPTKPAPPAPKTPVTPRRLNDENARPGSSTMAKSAGNASSKRQRDDKAADSTTPLQPSNRCRTPTVGRKTPTKRSATPGNVTPKKAQPWTTPTKIERSTSRSVLVEFSDEILTTPSRRLLSDQGTPTLSVKTSSTVSIRHDSPPSLNRSKSAGSLSVRVGDPLWRSRSEAKLYSDAPAVDGETSRVIVAARVRPLHSREPGNAVFVAGNELRVASDFGSVHRFAFDRCFPADSSTQEDVYDGLVRPLVDTAFQGFNACLFAYGQTGSGKTYSMMGPMHANDQLTTESGIIPRFCREMLERVSALDVSSNQPNVVSSTVEISYLEVYNEKIHDLLVPGSTQLKVREHPVYGPYVADLTRHTTSNFDELQRWINIGNQKRATAATEMNDKSSRSHSLFTVILTQTFAQVGSDGSWSHDQTRRSRINLVDLAGSERLAHTSVTTDRLREGVSINKSLLTLGKVMTALIEKRSHVPYRDSVLTWLLKESLGGNSRTTMLATISPSASQIEETLSTLRYASQARSIINTVRVNEEPQDKLIRELRAEIDRLRESGMEDEKIARPLPDDDNVRRLQDDLDHKRQNLADAEQQLSQVRDEKKNLEAKLAEYMENNRQLASKCAAANDVKIDSERGNLVDELVNLKEQHDSLKKHYLSLQDELEYEKGAKYQILSEKEADAGLIASLKSTVDKLESELLIEKNEAVLKDRAMAKLKEEIEEIHQAQDNLATTFLLKEEFCNAQALAEIERNELIAEKDKEIDNLKNELEKWTAGMADLVEQLSEFELIDNVKIDSESIATLTGRIKEQLKQEKLERQKLISAERDVADNIRQREQRWIVEYEDLFREKNLLEDEKNRLEEEKNRLEKTLKEVESGKNTVEAECDNVKDQLANADSLEKLVGELKEKIKTLENEKQTISSEKASLISEIDRLQGIEAKLAETLGESSKLKNDKAYEETEKLKRILSQKTAKLQYTEERLEKMKKETDSLRELNAELRVTQSTIEEESKKLKRENGELKNSMAEIQKEKESRCSSQSEEIANLRAEIRCLKVQNQFNEEMEKVNHILAQTSANFHRDEELIDKMKEELNSLRETNVELRVKYSIAEEELERIKEERDGLKNTNAELLKEKNSTTDVEEIRRLREEIQGLRNQNDGKFEKINDLHRGIFSNQSATRLQYAEERLEKMKEELDVLREANAELRVKFSSAEEELKKAKKRVEESNNANAELQKEKDSWSSAKSEEIGRLRTEIQGLQDRNRLLKRRARKSKLMTSGEDSKKLKLEISQLRKLNKTVVAEMEKVGKMARTETVDSLLQTAKEELSSAAGEIKVLKSENSTLSKRANKATVENESLREQMAKLEKEKADLAEKINRITGEKSVSEYKLRMSLVNTKHVEDHEEKLKQIRDKYDEQKESCLAHVAQIAELEHRLNLCQIAEKNLKAELDSKVGNFEDLKSELDTARKMQRELMDEKLALVKVMEKHFVDDNPDDKNCIIAENASLKKELQLSVQRLEQKTERIATLGARAGQLENLIVKVVDGTIRCRLELDDLKAAIVNKDYSAFDLLTGLYLPHHFEYLVRRARTVAENYRIPYDIDYSADDNKVVFRHLILTALAVLNRTILEKWIANIEEKNRWSASDDAELPWKVDMDQFVGRYPVSETSTSTESSALSLGVTKRKDGTLDPVEWRRTLIQRHVRGMKDDYSVLIKYFAEQDDSAIYAILERIRTSVDRLEQVTSNSTAVLENFEMTPKK